MAFQAKNEKYYKWFRPNMNVIEGQLQIPKSLHIQHIIIAVQLA